MIFSYIFNICSIYFPTISTFWTVNSIVNSVWYPLESRASIFGLHEVDGCDLAVRVLAGPSVSRPDMDLSRPGVAESIKGGVFLSFSLIFFDLCMLCMCRWLLTWCFVLGNYVFFKNDALKDLELALPLLQASGKQSCLRGVI